MANIEIFDGMAEKYDTELRQEIAMRTAHTIKETLNKLEIDGKTLIDYGCGTGLIGLELTDIFEKVTFIDGSEKMVEVMQKKIDALGLEGAEAICANAINEFDRAIKGDVLLLSQVLLHEPQIRPLLETLYEAVNPGGAVLIIDFDRNDKVESELVHPGFELMQLQADLLYAGFEPVYHQLFLHAEKYFMGQDASLFILVGKKD